MPIQNIGNDIVSAYTAGLNQRRQKEQQAIENQQKQTQIEQEQERIKNQKDEFQQQQEREKNQFQAEQGLRQHAFDLSTLQATPAFQALIEQKGSAPGFSTQPLIDESGNVVPGKLNVTGPKELGSPNFVARTPEQAAQEESQRLLTLAAPKLAEIKATQDAETDKELAGLKLKSQLDSVENNLKRQSEEKIQHEHDLERLEAARLHSRDSKDSSNNALNRTLTTQAVNAYHNSPLIKDFNVVKAANDFASKIDPNSKSGVSDTDLIYAYVKAENPESAREPGGDIKLAEAQNQSLADKFGYAVKRLGSNSQFLSPVARKEMVNSINERYKTALKGYTGLREETKRKLGTLGVEMPENILTDFTRGFETPTSAEPKPWTATGKKVKVKEKSSGQVGSIDEGELKANPDLFERQ